MSLSSAMNIALTGLRATQAGIGVVSTNVANAGTVGYVRRSINPVESASNGQSTGVRAGEATRMLDRILQKQLRLETAGAAYTDVKAQYYRVIDAMFGSPGGANALDTGVNALASALSQLQTNPSSDALRGGVLQGAQALAARLNSMSDQVQGMRRDAEASIGDAVGRANDLLSQLTKVSASIASQGASAPLLDQRDTIVSNLSQILDLRVAEQPNGSVSVFTTSGVQLFDGVAAGTLAFDARANIGPDSLLSADPAKRGVGTITLTRGTGGAIDLVAGGSIRSGEIAGYLEMRDDVLVEAQNQLDQLAAGLAKAFSTLDRPGTAALSGVQRGFSVDIAGIQNGDVVTLDTVAQPAGTPQRISFVAKTSAGALPNNATADASDRVVAIDFSGGAASAAAQIQAALGGGFTASGAGTAITILDDGAGGTTDVAGLSAAITQTQIQGGTNALPLFTDGKAGLPYTGSFENGSQLTGFAQRINLNGALLTDPAGLVKSSAATPAGDAARATFLSTALTGTSRSFVAESAGGGFGGSVFNGSVAGFSRRIVELQGANVEAAARLDEGQKVVLSNIEGRFAEVSGVNVDQEMSQLIQLQTAYTANARVITAAKEMMDLLLRM